MQFSACNYVIDQHVAYVTLNRPDKGNALNEQMICELIHIITHISDDIYLLCLRGSGKHFCTGADLYEMQHNLSDPKKLAQLLRVLHQTNVPILAAVNGAVFGGAMGLLACCDMVLAVDSAIFCLSEVKLGLVPAVISPYLIEALGVRQARAFMLSAERISAEKAMQLGLVQQLVTSKAFEDELKAYIDRLLLNGSSAMRTVKKLCREVLTFQDEDKRELYTTELLKNIRTLPEAQLRLKEFFEKKHV